MVPREAHNLKAPVRIRPPQQVKEKIPTFCGYFLFYFVLKWPDSPEGVGEPGGSQWRKAARNERRKTVGFRVNLASTVDSNPDDKSLATSK